MTIKEIDINGREWLKSSDLENLFTISIDKLSRYMYNLNMGLYINIDPKTMEEFVLTHDMHWPLISYKIYGTTRLAWLLQKVNKITTKDIFKIREAGEKIKYLTRSQLSQIINFINEDR